jgi:hypothetical protein
MLVASDLVIALSSSAFTSNWRGLNIVHQCVKPWFGMPPLK